MAFSEMVVPDSAPATKHPGERLQSMNGVVKDKLVQELPIIENKISDATHMKPSDGIAEAGVLSVYYTPDGPCKESGYHSEGYNSSMVSLEDSMAYDARSNYPGVHLDNGQHVYYAPGYGYPPQAAYCSQSPGSYMSNMNSGAPGYGPHLYGHIYQQVPSSSIMHYYPSAPVPSGQEGSKVGSKKANSNEPNQSRKIKQGGGGRQGNQMGYGNPVPPDGSNQWGSFSAGVNGGYYGPPSGYDYYSQQWPSSGRALPQMSSTQNGGFSSSYIPPLPAGCGRYQGFPRVYSAPNMAGRGGNGGSKASSGKPGSAGAGCNWRAKDASKHQGKGDVQALTPAASACAPKGPSQKPCVTKTKVHTAAQACGDADTPCFLTYVAETQSTVVNRNDYNKEDFQTSENQSTVVNRNDYNKEDFQTAYDAAKFFVIKSYSEDDVHKSIKYGVWSSTPNGNKRLDEAYWKAQEKLESISTSCPVFFFFSVNSSGQFCGVAEMVGAVDFNKNMDFWLQGKWSGCLPVKWHIVKDVPNCHFRHIILANNENKPVTHSRDTQEVHYQQGLEMLKIFKNFPIRTSLLDDFAFYDGRQRVLQERKLRQQQQQQQQQAVKQIKQRVFDKKSNESIASAYEDKENGKPDEVKNDVKAANLDGKVADLKMTGDVDCNSATVNSDNDSVAIKHETPTEPSEPVDLAACKSKSNLDSQSSGEGKPKLCSQCPSEGKAKVESQSLADGKLEVESAKPKLEPPSSAEGKPKLDSCPLSEGKPRVDTQSSAEGKDELTRAVINYKKALLEGIQGKATAVEQAVGV